MKKNTIDQKILRQVAGSFATGITVVCVKDAEEKVHGMTANSFLSVSLEPPLVLFSVQKNTKMMDYLCIGKEVGISILSEQQKPLSNQFAGLNEEHVIIEFDDVLPIPIIRDSLAWYCVEVHEIYEVGDHELIICAIKDLGQNEGQPLLYYSGYKSIGQSV